MALPQNLIVTPNQSEVGALPRIVSVGGDNFFQRPVYTGRELLTQSAPDVLATEWKSSAVMGEGIIGNSVILNGSTDYIDLSAKIPALTTRFIGFSAWIKINSISGNQTILSMTNDSVADRPLEFMVSDGPYGFYGYALKAGAAKLTTAIEEPQIGVWTHIFVESNSSTRFNNINLFINGSKLGNVHIANERWAVTGTPTATDFWVGRRELNTNIGDYFDGEICDIYWSTDPSFFNEVSYYYKLPTIEIV